MSLLIFDIFIDGFMFEQSASQFYGSGTDPLSKIKCDVVSKRLTVIEW